MGENNQEIKRGDILIHSKQGSNSGENTLDNMIKKLQDNINKENNKKEKSD